MKPPSPALVPADAVRRLPRAALWLFCLAYVWPGFWGREPWKREDISSLAIMQELASGHTAWLNPTLSGLQPRSDGLLAHWLGASLLMVAPDADWGWFLVRLLFAALLLLTFAYTWYGTFHLARSPGAQPVAFAFGGEANPTDYARALADGAVLALMASLGLAQLAHEATPAALQLAASAGLFYAAAALSRAHLKGLWALPLSLWALSLSGAPTVAMILGTLGALLVTAHARRMLPRRALLWIMVTWGLSLLAAAALATGTEVWRWRLDGASPSADAAQRLGRLLLWFPWPTWALALWALWRWRAQWLSRHGWAVHIQLPWIWVVVMPAVTALTPAGERSLLLALPALAALAAFALPTLSRSLSAWIDWFSLLFFSGCALVIWVIWVAMHTGFPAQPAANVARLAPAFVPSWTWPALAAALAATAAWAGLVSWRVSRHRPAIWKSLVLPAGGAALCWLLLTTLWLPLLNHARGYKPMIDRLQAQLEAVPMAAQPVCIHWYGLEVSQLAALRLHGKDWQAQPWKPDDAPRCAWLLVRPDSTQNQPIFGQSTPWQLVAQVGHPADRDETLFLYKRGAE